MKIFRAESSAHIQDLLYRSLCCVSSYLSSLSIAENSLSDTERLRSYFKKLVISEEFKAVFKAECSWRDKTKGIVTSACTGICKVLLLADVNNKVLSLR